MCNLYSLLNSIDELKHAFDIDEANAKLGNAEPLPAIFPRNYAPVIRRNNSGERELLPMHWGFLLPQKSKRTGKPILPKAVNNARDDKVNTSYFWRDSFNERRCLIPASSFCEAMGQKPATYYWFGLNGETERPLFAFAGLWKQYKGIYREELVDIETYTIVTTTPNALVEKIHPTRMPVILADESYNTWLSRSSNEAAELLMSYPAGRMSIVQSGIGLKMDYPFSKNPG